MEYILFPILAEERHVYFYKKKIHTLKSASENISL